MRPLEELAAAAGWSAEPRVERLDNGLTVCLLSQPRVPVVESALWYRAGARDEPAGEEGVAHFLEHMMFKGSPGYPEGAVDRLTQEAGGANQAFTSHDATAYQFGFSHGRWSLALALEADRMRELTLDREACDREREVILEEVAMTEDQPWEALERAVYASFYGGHPYGRPVVGTRAALGRIGVAELRRFHRRHYRPSRAVLAVAGDLPADALDRIAERFSTVPASPDRERPRAAPPAPPEGTTRVTQRRGSVDRLLLAMPAPAADAEDAAALRLLAAVLGSGRASRLQASLVEERRLFVWLAVESAETELPGVLAVAGETAPGVGAERAEAALLRELSAIHDLPATEREIDRARRILVADQVFATQRAGQQAALAAESLALFDLDHPRRQLARALACGREELASVADRYLRPSRSSVLGWSLAERRPSEAGE